MTLENNEQHVQLSHWTDAPNPATRFTVSKDAAIYIGSYDDPLPVLPAGFTALRLTSGFSSDNHDPRSVIIIWSLDGEEMPTADQIGSVDKHWVQVQ